MRRLMVCVKQVGETAKCEIGVFEEQADGTATEVEANALNPIICGLRVVMDEIGEVERSMELGNPYSELADRIRKHFKN